MRITLLSNQYKRELVCSSCQESIPSPLGSIEGAPAILGCSHNPNIKEDKFLDYHIYVCPFCGLIQTDARLDSQIYEIVHSHALGGVWREHGNKLAEFISECLGNRLEKLETTLEIGPSVSPILKRLVHSIPFVQYIDLMDEAPFKLNLSERYKKQSFPSAQFQGKYDLIVASHVLEHTESLYGFMEAIKCHLSVNGIAVLSIPNFHKWITKKYWNAITSEHLNYPFIEHLQDVSIRLGLDVEFAYFKEHSLFIQVSHSSADMFFKKPPNGNDRDNSSQILEDWINEINTKITIYEDATGDTSQEVILAGASHLSQYVVLISERIRSKVKIVLDNAADKHGKRLYGTELIAQPFDIVKRFQSPIVIVPPSPYLGEMVEQTLRLNPGTQIVK